MEFDKIIIYTVHAYVRINLSEMKEFIYFNPQEEKTKRC